MSKLLKHKIQILMICFNSKIVHQEIRSNLMHLLSPNFFDAAPTSKSCTYCQQLSTDWENIKLRTKKSMTANYIVLS